MKTTTTILTVALALMAICNVAEATDVYFDDGDTHNIDYEIDGYVYVDPYGPMGTTVNLLDGGSINGILWPSNNSNVNISGGTVTAYLSANGISQITISGGVIAEDLWAKGSSQVILSDGSIRDLYAYDSSDVDISGGSIGADLHADNSSRVTISSGSIWYHLRVNAYSQVIVTGGSIGQNIISKNESILTIYGSSFAVDGTPFGYGELTSILGGDWNNESSRRLTGTLASGDSINNDFRIGNDAKIVLIPEPSFMLVGGLVLLMVRRKK